MGASPRSFPTTGFEAIAPYESIEEERLPFYTREHYYPARIGSVIKGRYQIVAKLGFGTSSTVWLAHDLNHDKYWALKIHTNTLQHIQELQVYQHLADARSEEEHPGEEYVRRLEDCFTMNGPHGEHLVFVMTPLGMSLKTFQEMQKSRVFHSGLVRGALDQELLGIAYLHEAGVIHTDLHADNLLIALTDPAILSKMEKREIENPSPRKVVGDNVVHVSQYVMGGAGALTICDLGQARIGCEQHGNAMPIPYRAPEVFLGMPWGSAVDIWSVGLLAWDLLETPGLFSVLDHGSHELNDAHHLAAMTALLGPPPVEFLKRSKKTSKYWDGNGQWKGPVPLPPEKKLESLTPRSLEGIERENFLSFLECVLDWMPENRPQAHQMYMHPWLRGKNVIDGI